MEIAGTPVSTGSPEARSVHTAAFSALDIRFPRGLTLPRHHHEDATFVVVLGGAFERISGGRRFKCVPGAVFSEPAGEPHSNEFGPAGASVAIVQPRLASSLCTESQLRPFLQPTQMLHPGITRLACALMPEIQGPDAYSALAVDGIVLQMLAVAGRSRAGEHHPRKPRWLGSVIELLHEECAKRMSLGEIAGAAGVHPAHLSRSFRRHVGSSVAEYARRVRLASAARSLAGSRRSISQIAAEAGFADQSHFTRAFRSYYGATPARYREDVQPTSRNSGEPE